MKAIMWMLVLANIISVTGASASEVDHATEILGLLEEGGGRSIIEYIQGFEPAQRIELYQLAREVMVFQGWSDTNMEDIVIVSEAGIQDAMGQANQAEVTLARVTLLDMANVMSFNLAADIAECWPGDVLERRTEHFERGVSAALQCVEWRRELEKDDYSLFIAYWAAGMNQMSLGRCREAVYNLVKSLNHAQQYTVDQGRPLGICPEAGFELILAHGYLGLAMELCGEGDEQYTRALEVFQEGIDQGSEFSEDYDFGIDQLEWARERLLQRWGDGSQDI